MSTVLRAAVFIVACLTMPMFLYGQDAADPAPTADGLSVENVRERAEDLAADTQETVDDLAKQIDQNPRAHEVSAGVLQPIYTLAEAMSFRSFHWIAFTFMVTGVVSFGLQLVLGKLVVLSKMSISLKEILSDSVGLVISLIGLVLTTQAATENSTFTESPAAVLSAAGVGVLLGFVFYLWGQSQEVQAAVGRKVQGKSSK